MLDANIKQQLNAHFSNIHEPVELVVALDDTSKSAELEQLAKDLASLSGHISLSYSDDTAVRRPSMAVRSAVRQTEIAFAGIPMGHEFTSLVLAVLHSGGHDTKVSDADLAVIRGLSEPLQFETYISLSCQTCPGVVQALNLMAAINPAVRHTMIDGALFQAEVNERNILAVPAVYLNGQSFSQGAVTLSDILNKLDSSAGKHQVEAINQKMLLMCWWWAVARPARRRLSMPPARGCAPVLLLTSLAAR